MLAAFREKPGNITHAARVVGCNYRTAKRGWDRGWPNDATWAVPICEVIGRERDQARKELGAIVDQGEDVAKRIESALKAASDEAVADRVDAALLARRVHALALPLIESALVLARLSIPLTEAILKTSMARLAAGKSDVSELFDVHARLRRLGLETAELALHSAKLERMALGEPDSVVKMVHSMDEAQALEELREATEVLARVQQRGVLRVVSPSDG